MNQGQGIDANKVDDNGNPDQKNGRSDADDFGDAVKAWHDYSIENARDLANPNSPNYINAQSDKQELLQRAYDIMDKSKDKSGKS